MVRLASVSLASVVLVFASLCPAQAVGWRGDGSGHYPQAQPPTQWGPDKNIVWKCPLPKTSNAMPVIVGDRIFVCGEPTDLICVSKADGKILWARGNNYDLVMTEADKAQAAKDGAESARIRKEELGPVEKQQRESEKRLQEVTPAKPKWAGTNPATRPAPTPPTATQQAEIDQLKPRIAELKKQIDAIKKKLTGLAKWAIPPTEGSNGHSSATPVSDGKVVAAVFNNGLAVCYDLEGKLQWSRLIDKPTHDWGSSSSPLIHQDKMLVHFVNMVALDLATGKELWKAPATDWHWGSPILARVGEIDVAITAAGDVIRLADGKVMVKKLIALEYSSPVFKDGVAYFIANPGRGVKLTAKGADEIMAEPLWTTRPKNDRYYGSPVLLDGLIYAVNQVKVFSVIDAATGKVEVEKDLALGKQTMYSSIVRAGPYIYVSNEDGNTLVLEPGKEMKEVARNELGDRFRSTPVFEAARMYIRAQKALYCIGQ